MTNFFTPADFGKPEYDVIGVGDAVTHANRLLQERGVRIRAPTEEESKAFNAIMHEECNKKLTLAHTRIRELEAALEKLQNFITANANGGCLTCNDLAKEFKDA